MQLTVAQRWILSLAAPVHQDYELSHEWIGGAPITRNRDRVGGTALEDDWDVTSRRSLLVTLAKIERASEHRGFSIACFVAAAGWGVREGFMTEPGFWERVTPLAREAQQRFNSFREFGADYACRSADTPDHDAGALALALHVLHTSPLSPWCRLPWALDLDAAENSIPELPFGPREQALRQDASEPP